MIPNRVVRYFFYLGCALGHGGRTRFSAFKRGIGNFYHIYLRPEHYVKSPHFYPNRYGMN